MSSHEELNEQWLTAVALDDMRDARRRSYETPLTLEEQKRGIEALAKWPKDKREEILRMEPNERDWMLLLAGMLGAAPVDNFPPGSEGAAQ
jgi:hypothetical protein